MWIIAAAIVSLSWAAEQLSCFTLEYFGKPVALFLCLSQCVCVCVLDFCLWHKKKKACCTVQHSSPVTCTSDRDGRDKIPLWEIPVLPSLLLSLLIWRSWTQTTSKWDVFLITHTPSDTLHDQGVLSLSIFFFKAHQNGSMMWIFSTNTNLKNV